MDKLKDLFCNDEQLIESISDLVAHRFLGDENKELIETRYNDMKDNFDNYPEYYYNKLKEVENLTEDRKWHFSEGLKPFNGYIDTSDVILPIKHECFKDIVQLDKGAIGIDLPTWFNISYSRKRIMLIAQDPLRSKVWYGGADGKMTEEERKKYVNRKCNDAVLSSPFGLHINLWRENGRGGKRIWLLVQKLIGLGYGIYLTDCRKYFVYDHAVSAAYSERKREKYKEILVAEINTIKPDLIVCLGNSSYSYCSELLDGTEHSCLIKRYPHFSGAASWKIKDFFIKDKSDGQNKLTIEQMTNLYADSIKEEVEKLDIR